MYVYERMAKFVTLFNGSYTPSGNGGRIKASSFDGRAASRSGWAKARPMAGTVAGLTAGTRASQR